MSQLEEFMNALEAETGAAPFTKNEDNGYTLVFDDLPGIDFLTLPGNRIFLKARVSALSGDEPERDRLLKEILKLNLARVRQQKETISYEPEEAAVWLHSVMPAALMPVHLFRDRVTDFVNSLEFWCQTLEDLMGAGGFPHGMPSGAVSPMIDPGMA